MSADVEDLSDYDIHLVIESLQTRNSQSVVRCALSIDVLMTEIQLQLVSLLNGKANTNCQLDEADTNYQPDEADTNDRLEESSHSPIPSDNAVENMQEVGDSWTDGNNSEESVEHIFSKQVSLKSVAMIPIAKAKKKVQKKISCRQCDQWFTSRESLSLHMHTHNVQNDPGLCNDDIEGQTYILTIEKPEVFPARNSPSNNGDSLNNTVFPGDNAVNGTVKNSDNSAVFPLTEAKNEAHQLSVFKVKSKPKPKRATCDICGKEVTAHHLLRHMRLHTGDTPYACPVCTSKYSRKDKLKEHMQKKHPEITDKNLCVLKCDLCDFLAEDVKGLRIHYKESHIKMKESHTKTVEVNAVYQSNPQELPVQEIFTQPAVDSKIFACDECGITFTNAPNLQRHKRIHSGEKPYKCSYCDKEYSRTDKINEHMERMHSEHKPTGIATAADVPVAVAAADTITPKFKCKFCSKGFNDKKETLCHESTHSGERPYQCSKCGCRFTASRYLRRHEFLHTGIKPHICLICGKSFARREGLKKHKEVHIRAAKKQKEEMKEQPADVSTTENIMNMPSMSTDSQSSSQNSQTAITDESLMTTTSTNYLISQSEMN